MLPETGWISNMRVGSNTRTCPKKMGKKAGTGSEEWGKGTWKGGKADMLGRWVQDMLIDLIRENHEPRVLPHHIGQFF